MTTEREDAAVSASRESNEVGESVAVANRVTHSVWPIIRDEAIQYLRDVHRHNKRSLPGWKFGVGLYENQWPYTLVGVGIAGRCSSRVLDKRGAGHFIEVTRVGTEGIYNGCSRLYGALTKAAKSLGYCRAYTYTLDEESGASLLASGWTIDARLPARTSGGWDCESRPRDEADWPEQAKVRWVKRLAPCTLPEHFDGEG